MSPSSTGSAPHPPRRIGLLGRRKPTLARLAVRAALSSHRGVRTSPSETGIVVSLTSYPPRFRYLHLALESLLGQTLRPDRLVLWLAEGDLRHLPANVWRLEKRGLDIRACKDIKSYKKIIYALQAHANSVIVTADDDIAYPPDWLESLVASYRRAPKVIHCHRARLITFDPHGNINRYVDWPILAREELSACVIPIGVGGVLYPPHSLHELVCEEAIFMSLCEFGDDIWLKTMSLMNGVLCKKLSADASPATFYDVPSSQAVSLMDTNLNGRNDAQIDKVFTRFGILDKLQQLSSAETPIGPAVHAPERAAPIKRRQAPPAEHHHRPARHFPPTR